MLYSSCITAAVAVFGKQYRRRVATLAAQPQVLWTNCRQRCSLLSHRPPAFSSSSPPCRLSPVRFAS
ncbi:unnamed protein product [Chondrus crispus]|uniref:Uncharacterized protein n=1 Tax=Chondrus crispus TaxID=2769 RepID=R7QQT7_CHOCR|nr:unnamed protein product [Chondrus crispus]CDF39755.1 unnamed protein product [Chondrus crispus]|eukprot:XP_005710049.1 unnamed protein product [Chondrus crispus]